MLLDFSIFKKKAKPIRFLIDWRLRFEERSDCFKLFGDLINDPEYPEQPPWKTTMVLKIDFVKMEAETKNSIYKLIGPMSSDEQLLEEEF